MKNIIEKCKQTKILGVIGIIGLILGTITPYIKITIWGYSSSASLWQNWEGKVIMLLAAINAFFIFNDVVEKSIPSLFDTNFGKKIKECDKRKLSLVCTIISAILTIAETNGLGVDSFEYYNIGFYTMWIGTISLVFFAFLYKKEDDSFKMKM